MDKHETTSKSRLKSQPQERIGKEPKKTKILAIGDIHGDTGLVKRLVERAKKENVDVVILAGDLTFAEQSIEYIVGPFVKAKKHVLLIPGNHESMATIDFLAEAYPNTKNIHAGSFRKNSLGIFGAGTANIGIHQIGDENIFKALNKGHEEIVDCQKKVMVTHMHPFGSRAEMFGFRGSKAIRKAIDKFTPDFLIDAHIHEAAGMEEKIGKTIVINVSRKEKIFEI
ncbi:MAG: metallophosphoesterase [Nanoarchaeota archaeon]